MGRRRRPSLRGQQRHELVDRLEAAFDDVVARRSPRVVCLEAGTGWGKTRLVQELYARIAARQQGTAYWPPELVNGPGPDGGQVGTDGSIVAHRKDIVPTGAPVDPDAELPWLWWGLVCGRRADHPIEAIAHDIGQLTTHAAALEERWRRTAGLRARTARGWRNRSGELGESVVSDGIGVVAGAANVAFPGLGLVMLAAKWSVEGLHARLIRRDHADEPDDATAGRQELVDDLTAQLVALGRAGIPVVIAVEDVHDADASLVELLVRLAGEPELPVLVVATAWPGLVDEATRAASALVGRVPPHVLDRWRLDDPQHELTEEDRRELIADVAAELPDELRDGLLAVHRTPLGLLVATDVVAGRLAEARVVTAESVAALPAEVETLYELAWDVLPESIRTTLMVAALLSPSVVTSVPELRTGGWDRALVAATAAAVPFLARRVGDDPDAPIDRDVAYGWGRRLDDWQTDVQEPGQADIVVRQALSTFGDDRTAIYPVAGAVIARWLGDGLAGAQAVHDARLLVALALEGFVPWSTGVVRALDVLFLTARFAGTTRTWIGWAEEALDGLAGEPVEEVVLELRIHLAEALHNVSRPADALDTLPSLVADADAFWGADHDRPLHVRHVTSLCLGALGRRDEALGVVVDALAAAPGDLPLREHLALAERRACLSWTGGDMAVSVDRFTEVADRWRERGEPGMALRIRSHLAQHLTTAGATDRTVEEMEAVVREQAASLGPIDFTTLASTVRLAEALDRAGRDEEAITCLSEAVDALAEASRERDFRALGLRRQLADLRWRSGHREVAVTEGRSLLADEEEVYGASSAATVHRALTVAEWLLAVGRPGEAVPILERWIRLLDDDDVARRTELTQLRGVLIASRAESSPIDVLVVELSELAQYEGTGGHGCAVTCLAASTAVGQAVALLVFADPFDVDRMAEGYDAAIGLLESLARVHRATGGDPTGSAPVEVRLAALLAMIEPERALAVLDGLPTDLTLLVEMDALVARTQVLHNLERLAEAEAVRDQIVAIGQRANMPAVVDMALAMTDVATDPSDGEAASLEAWRRARILLGKEHPATEMMASAWRVLRSEAADGPDEPDGQDGEPLDVDALARRLEVEVGAETAAAEMADVAERRRDAGWPLEAAKAANWAGHLRFQCGDLDAAGAAFAQARQLIQEVDTPPLADLITYVGNSALVHGRRGEVDAALRLRAEVIDLAARAGDRSRRASALHALGHLLHDHLGAAASASIAFNLAAAATPLEDGEGRRTERLRNARIAAGSFGRGHGPVQRETRRARTMALVVSTLAADDSRVLAALGGGSEGPRTLAEALAGREITVDEAPGPVGDGTSWPVACVSVDSPVAALAAVRRMTDVVAPGGAIVGVVLGAARSVRQVRDPLVVARTLSVANGTVQSLGSDLAAAGIAVERIWSVTEILERADEATAPSREELAEAAGRELHDATLHANVWFVARAPQR